MSSTSPIPSSTSSPSSLSSTSQGGLQGGVMALASLTGVSPPVITIYTGIREMGAALGLGTLETQYQYTYI